MAKGAPFRLNSIMSRNRFDSILSALRFMNREVPYEDGFLQLRQLEEAWNHNMAQHFLPSWINVLDESMMAKTVEPYSGSMLPPIGAFVRSHPHMAHLYS